MYRDSKGTTVMDTEPYRGIDGTRYPGSFPKNLIKDLEHIGPDPEKPRPEPTDIEIRLAALEAKAGITEEDKQSAKQEMKEKK